MKTWSGWDRLIVEKPESRGYLGILAAYSSKWSLISYQVHERAILRGDFIQILDDVFDHNEEIQIIITD
jgi:hypothetical protein